MSNSNSHFTVLFCSAIVLVLCITPVSAFGAGNIGSISAIEGLNWRHGDIEDTLLNIFMARVGNGGKKFSKLDVSRVYFGNWLRDYSQAVDVGTVKYVSAQAITLLIWVLGFSTFGYGSGEFQVTVDRLGCYRPEEHIDNPKDYADNLDARQYDPRLRGPVNERLELGINPQTGLKNYIASENLQIETSAALIRRSFGRCIQLGRQYGRSKNKADLYEALRLLGQGCHCLEDYTAHSNYCETALIELGEVNTFAHVGRQTAVSLPGVPRPVWPIVTGTFGGTDFAYSVMGEFGDKAAQSEIQELQGTMQASQDSGQNVSILQSLLSQVPSTLLGGDDQAGKIDQLQVNAQAAQMAATHISPRQPEAWANQLQEISKAIYPILEWHDEIMKSITEFIEEIPILPDLIDQLKQQVNIFVFTLLAPLILPIINQVKTELANGSSDIIKASKAKQHIVFYDDHSSNPTHSMLSKDHFTNVLNEAAGKVASQVLKWTVPQIMACWDDERIDVNRTLTRIINGVFHHPALRNRGDDGAVDCRRGMFQVMQQWWGQKPEQERAYLRNALSREGVQQGLNQKEGDTGHGHGCGRAPSGPARGGGISLGGSTLPIGSILGQINDALAGQSQYDPGATKVGSGKGLPTERSGSGFGGLAASALGGGALGAVAGVAAGKLGADLLGDVFGGSNAHKQNYQSQQYAPDGSYTQNYTQTGYSIPQGGQPQVYGQAQYSQTNYATGGERLEYQQYRQDGAYGAGGYGEDIIQESRPMYGGGYEQVTETRYRKPGNEWETDIVRQEQLPDGEVIVEEEQYSGDGRRRNRRDYESGFERDYQAENFREEEVAIDERYGGGFPSMERRRIEEERLREEARLEEVRLEEERFREERRRNEYVDEYVEERPAFEREEFREERFGADGEVREERFQEEEVFEDDRGYGRVEEFEERRDYGGGYSDDY